MGRNSTFSSKVREAKPDAPWMPSRPVPAPTRRMTFPTSLAAEVAILSVCTRPTHMALTNGFWEYDSSKQISPATSGTPMQLPYQEIPSTTPWNRCPFWGSSRGPNRREFRRAMGRAPMARMSRTMPPTPVAAPCNGSTAEGWLWDSTLKTTASPSPISTAPAFSAPVWDNTRVDFWLNRRSNGRECL